MNIFLTNRAGVTARVTGSRVEVNTDTGDIEIDGQVWSSVDYENITVEVEQHEQGAEQGHGDR